MSSLLANGSVGAFMETGDSSPLNGDGERDGSEERPAVVPITAPANGHSPDVSSGESGWSVSALRQSGIAGKVLEDQARRLEAVPASGETLALREVLLIVSPWGAAHDPVNWQAKAARIETLIAMNANLSAAIGLLPSCASYYAQALCDEPVVGNVVLAEGITGTSRNAATAALSLAAAMFFALARITSQN